MNEHNQGLTDLPTASSPTRPLAETAASWVPAYFGDDYLRLYQFPATRTAPETAWLARVLATRIPADGCVLDLGCGQGRHAVPLARLGYRVIGLDYQANLLAAAQQAAQAAQAPLHLVRGDMRQVPLAGVCDAVLSLFSAFGYFEDADNVRVLRAVARALRPAGWLVMDVANQPYLVATTSPRSEKILPDGTRVEGAWQWDAQRGRYTHRQTLTLPDGEQRYYAHSVRVYTREELTAQLAQVGLVPESVNGGFCGEAYGPDAPRLLLVARKLLET